MTIDFESVGTPALAPRRGSDHQPGNHFVQFYGDDSNLIDSLRTFIGGGLAEGETSIIVANQTHRDTLELALVTAGFDVQAARAQGRYIALDTEKTLDTFMVGGMPDPTKFAEVMDSIIGPAAQKGKVRIFGEMVAVLWTQNNSAAAISLEMMWNQLAKTHPFRLYCAYPVRAFGSNDLVALRKVCYEHSQVIPPGR